MKKHRQDSHCRITKHYDSPRHVEDGLYILNGKIIRLEPTREGVGQISGSTLKAAIQSRAALHQGWHPASATGEKLGARSHADWEVLNREGRVRI